MSTTTEPLLKVSTSDKKYTVVQHSNGSLEILRCGEHWMDKTGNNFILTLAQDLDGARESGSKLAAELLWIVQGIRDGHIKSKPTIDRSDENATEWPMVTLEEHIWKALNSVGIREAQPA